MLAKVQQRQSKMPSFHLSILLQPVACPRIMRHFLYFALSLGLALTIAAEEGEPVKVFILAGQSNMEGKGKIDPLLNHQIQAPETKAFFAHFHKDGKYIERDDVWINYLKRRGKLTVGYGSPGCIGLELEFGHVMGNHYDEPVLLIKTAWGGKSIGRDFRPPSSGLQPDEKINESVENRIKRDYNNLIRDEWNKDKKENPKITRKEVEEKSSASMDQIRKAKAAEYHKQVVESYGHFYRLMMTEIKTTLTEIKTRFPQYDGRGYDIAGFVWFQGWNDMFNDNARNDYQTNLVHLINDIRKEVGQPDLPVVIGELGNDGRDGGKPMLAIRAAQKAAAKALGPYTVFVPTTQFARPAKESPNVSHGHHWYGNAESYFLIGDALGQALLNLNTK